MDQRPNIPQPGGELVYEVPPLPAYVEDFSGRLETLSDPRMRTEGLPDFRANIDDSGREQIDHAQQLGRLNHAYFAEGIRGHLGEQPPSNVAFELKDGWRLGREESQHQTFFGVMTVTNAAGEAEEVEVAVKTFPYNVGSHAIQEVALLQDLAARGLPTVEPLGLVMHRWSKVEPCLFLILRREPDLESLNAQDWTNLVPEEVSERVRPVVDTLVMLHEQGISNRELAFGNVAVGEEQGSRYIFDLENARSMRALLESVGPEDPIPEDLLIAIGLDFIAPRASLRNVVYPNLPPLQRPRTVGEAFEHELALLYEPYHEAIARSESPYRDVLERAYRTFLENVRRQVEQEADDPLPKQRK